MGCVLTLTVFVGGYITARIIMRESTEPDGTEPDGGRIPSRPANDSNHIPIGTFDRTESSEDAYFDPLSFSTPTPAQR